MSAAEDNKAPASETQTAGQSDLPTTATESAPANTTPEAKTTTTTTNGADHSSGAPPASGDAPATDQTGEQPAEAPNETGDSAAAPEADALPTSAKKNNGKRRSSTGVAEHKSKKVGKKGKPAPVLQLNVKPGEFYWARLKGHPPWPAVICDEDMLPEKIAASRPVTAQRPDGSYREDYMPGGKNVRDRTYAVMYLGTYEFSWMPNIDLSPIDPAEIENATPAKKTKALWSAYSQLKEQPPLSHFKQVLDDHHQAILAREAEQEAKAQAQQEAKANKSKRKSKGAAADDDEDMPDAPEDGAKPSKKRKKTGESDAENDKPAKTPKTKLKVSLKTPNGDSASKPKPKSSSTKKAKKVVEPEPELTPEAIFELRKKQILYIRHKLQKGFLSRDTPPKEEEMSTMADHLGALEQEAQLEARVIRATRINKVLKGILKLSSIPRDEEFRFKERSSKLLEIWNKILAEDKTGEDEADKKNGVAVEGDSEAKGTPVPKAEAKPDNAASESATAPATKEEKPEVTPVVATQPAEADASAIPGDENKKTEAKVEETKGLAPPAQAETAVPVAAATESEKEAGAAA